MLITKTQAAKRLGLSRPTIYALIYLGKLKTVTPVRREMVLESSVEDLLNGKVG